MAPNSGSVDPSRFPNEAFDLYSIPAFDNGRPQLSLGREIGSSKQIVHPNDVLLSRIVPHIRRAWVVDKQRDHRQIASGEWIVFRSAKTDPSYLRYLLVEDRFHAQFMNTVAGVGGSLLRARPAQVADIEVPLPSLPQQRRIAERLEQADRLCHTRRYALELTDSFLPAAFLEFFGDTRGGADPKVTLQEVADIITGYPFPSQQYVTSGDAIRLCRGANVLPGRIDWSDLAAWSPSKIAHLHDFMLKPGDVLVAMDRPWISEGFKVTQVQPEDCPSLLVQRVARLRGRNGVPNSYLYYLLRQKSFTRHCRPTETTIPHISPTEIQTFSFCFPPLPLQHKFAAIVERVERLRAVQREALRQAEHLFASLLYHAFNASLH
jgi:type I restriction enzyme S subunit